MRKIKSYLIILGFFLFILSSCGGPLEVTVSFDTNGGSYIESMILNEESPFTLPNDPTKEGHTFLGWYLDDTLETPFSVEGLLALEPVGSYTVYASWQVNQYTITFDPDNGSPITSITQDYGTAITAPANPTKTNYLFLGWNPSIPSTMPAFNMNLKAIWEYDPIALGTAPVYQGMDVTAVSSVSAFPQRFYNWSFEDSNIIDDIPTIDIPEQPDIVYYSARNEDVYVRVILDNPDSQVILRFTLNGVVYQSFEFEEGSTSELLIVKVNAGDLSGIHELTIDEIKYVENVSNDIKDAEFEGDRTITMAVTYDHDIEATISEEVVTSTSYRSVITINDPDNLSVIYENAPVFYLSDGTNIIYTQALTNGNNIIEYPYLHPSRTYVYAVATTYDLLDGEGAQVRIASTKGIETNAIVSLETIEAFQEALSFNITPNDPNNTGAVSAIELYQGETLVEALSDLSLRQFSNLLSNNTYEIRVTYTYDLNDGNGAQTVTTPLSMTTLAKATPTLGVQGTTTQESIAFDYDVADIDSVGDVTSIELYLNGALVETLSDLSLRQFSNLLSNNTYEIRVTYTYDLNDGNGAQTVMTPLSITTLAKATPSVEVISVTPEQEALTFDLNIIDVDTVGSVTAIELYQGETFVESLTDLTLRSFTGLLSNNAYEIRVTYTYDLNDGNGAQTVTTPLSMITLAKAITIDSLELLNTQVFDGDTVRFRLEVTNPDNVDVQSVVIDGVTIDVDSTTTTSTLKFRFEVNGSMETLTYIIEELILENGQRLRVTLNNILEVSILPNITIEDAFSSNMKHYGTMENQAYIIVFEDAIANSITGIESSAPNSNAQSLNESQINVLDDYTLEVFMNSTITGWVDFKINSVNILISSLEYSIPVEYNWREYIVSNEAPILISNPEDLRFTEYSYLYELSSDLDFSGIDWDSNGLSFKGVLLGNNHKILNFRYVDYNSLDSRSSFSIFDRNDGVINDLIIEDIYMSLEKEHSLYVSGLANFNMGVINNVKVSGEIETTSTEGIQFSGITLYNYEYAKIKNIDVNLVITNSSPFSEISGVAMSNFNLIDYTKIKILINNNSDVDALIGGIVCTNFGLIKRTEVDATIRSYSDKNNSNHVIGGTGGYNFSTINYSFANVNLETSSFYSYTGGVVGRNEGQIYNSISDGLVNTISFSNGSTYSGGFVGQNVGVIKSSYSKVQTNVDNSSILWSGGFVGGNDGGSIENSFSYTSGFNDPFVYSNNGELKDNFTTQIEGITEFEGITYLGSLQEIIEAIMESWDQNIWDFTDLDNPSLFPLKTYDINFFMNEEIFLNENSYYNQYFLMPTISIEGYELKGIFLEAEFLNKFEKKLFKLNDDLSLYLDLEINSYEVNFNIYDEGYNTVYNNLRYNENLIFFQAGYINSLAVTNTSRVFIWGNNDYYQLGDETLQSNGNPKEITDLFNLNLNEKIIDASSSSLSMIVLTSEGRVMTWGNNFFGTIGNNYTGGSLSKPQDITSNFNLEDGEKVIDVVAGALHVSALTNLGRVFTWGEGSYGYLGNGGSSSSVPYDITLNFDLNEEDKIVSLFTLRGNSAVITDQGKVFVWGINDNGQLGDGSTDNKFSPFEITTLFNLENEEKIKYIKVGQHSSLVLSTTGRIFTFGIGYIGARPEGEIEDLLLPVDITYLFDLDDDEMISEISQGFFHYGILTSKGKVFTWGNNDYGQLGDGTTTFSSTPIEITQNLELLENEIITNISFNYYHSSFTTSLGRIFMWGMNDFGVLGDGDASSTNFHKNPMLVNLNFLYSGKSEEYNFNETIIEYIPIREGYTFSGWFLDEALTQSYTFGTMPSNDLELYGKWIPNEE